MCPNWARTDLCGGREVTRVPTANLDPKLTLAHLTVCTLQLIVSRMRKMEYIF